MTVKVIQLTTLEKTGKSPLDALAPKLGIAYVVAITRDGCQACKRQKPRLDKLAKALVVKHGSRVGFTRIHINYSPELQEESLRSKDLLRHYFYPTNLIVVRSRDRGAFEFYRNVSASIPELRKNIEKAVEVAKFFEKSH